MELIITADDAGYSQCRDTGIVSLTEGSANQVQLACSHWESFEPFGTHAVESLSMRLHSTGLYLNERALKSPNDAPVFFAGVAPELALEFNGGQPNIARAFIQ